MEPAFEIGGTANAPRTPPLVRHRRGTGIGNATRFVEDPAERQATHAGVNAALPERVRPPSADLPLLVQPRDAACGDAAAWGRAARALLDERLAQVGAVLLHGLPISCAADFDAFVGGMGYPSMDTMGASNREQKAGQVFGASDDVPPDFSLHPHNEQAYLAPDETPSYPRKIFFCCLQVAPVGGETPFVINSELTRRIAPAHLERFREEGVRYRQTLPSGAVVMGDPSENQVRTPLQSPPFCPRLCLTRRCGGAEPRGRADVAVALRDHRRLRGGAPGHRPGLHLRVVGSRGGGAWADADAAVGAAGGGAAGGSGRRGCGEAGALLEPGEQRLQLRAVLGRRYCPPRATSSPCPLVCLLPYSPIPTSLSLPLLLAVCHSALTPLRCPGTPIEDEVLEGLNAAIWHSAVAFEWSAGDVLCLDNELAQHGRMSFEGPRELVVAFSKL